ncbi:hypothetical protein RJQ12_30905, partial [Paenibacillus taichungensis]|nr:hypothetical protein [Paenibacillus taichungensis]
MAWPCGSPCVAMAPVPLYLAEQSTAWLVIHHQQFAALLPPSPGLAERVADGQAFPRQPLERLG